MGIGLFTLGALVLLAGSAVMIVVAAVAIWIMRRRPGRPGPDEGAGAGNPGSGTWLASDFGGDTHTQSPGHHSGISEVGGGMADCGTDGGSGGGGGGDGGCGGGGGGGGD